MVLTSTMYIWEVARKCGRDPNTAPLHAWMKMVVSNNDKDAYSMEDRNKLLLSRKPLQKTLRYFHMKAFGNHFRVNDVASCQLETYDCSVTCVFEVPAPNLQDMLVHYVEVLKDILKLDYGSFINLVVLMRFEWVKK